MYRLLAPRSCKLPTVHVVQVNGHALMCRGGNVDQSPLLARHLSSGAVAAPPKLSKMSVGPRPTGVKVWLAGSRDETACAFNWLLVEHGKSGDGSRQISKAVLAGRTG